MPFQCIRSAFPCYNGIIKFLEQLLKEDKEKFLVRQYTNILRNKWKSNFAKRSGQIAFYTRFYIKETNTQN